MPIRSSESLKPVSEIRIRDPFILPYNGSGLYYMYAQIHNRDKEAPAGVEVYWSLNLKQWAGPERVLALPEGFWGSRTVWAPEVHAYDGRYFLFATMHPQHEKLVDGMGQKGTQIFVADSPTGPFAPFANRPHLNPEWMTLDGTLYVEEGQPWMVFCHEWGQVKDGTMELIKLKNDLSETEGKPTTLFTASQAPWAEGFGENKDNFVTDGPSLFKTKTGTLLMIWSTIGKGSTYKQGMAVSESGKLSGPWKQLGPPLIENDGGHGMIFKSFAGDLLLAIHQPNKGDLERLHLFNINDAGDRVELIGEVPLP